MQAIKIRYWEKNAFIVHLKWQISFKQPENHQYANLTLLININDTTKPKQFAFIYNCTTKAIKCNLIKLHNVNSKCSCPTVRLPDCPTARLTVSWPAFNHTNRIDLNTNIYIILRITTYSSACICHVRRCEQSIKITHNQRANVWIVRELGGFCYWLFFGVAGANKRCKFYAHFEKKKRSCCTINTN